MILDRQANPSGPHAHATRCAALGLMLILLGCKPIIRNYIAEISSAEPDVAVQAMSKAADKRDPRAILPLVKRLYDEDPATRFCANQALMTITGQDMGFRSY